MTGRGAVGYDASIAHLSSGIRLGSYEIVAPIGAGGMGEVYRATDIRLRRDVAVKVLPPALASDRDALSRFEREARAIAALSHPNILALYDVGSDRGIAYAVTELLEGETLRSRLDASGLSPRKAIDIAVEIARALAAAHDKGIVHRDLKPENVFITRDGGVKVLDFGLARLLGPPHVEAASDTRTHVDTRDGIVMGTVGYMSPEQVRGVPADHRSDIFSCGVVLYEMLSRRRPFEGDSAVETMHAILKEHPPALVVADAALAPPLRRIVEHCLEKEAEERFQSARDLAFDLDALRTASDPGMPVPADRRTPRRLSALTAAAVALLALAVGVGAGRVFWRDSGTNPAPTFTRLTYEKGTIWTGRFAPDEQNVVYGAAWDGGPIRTFLSRTDRPGSTALNVPDALLLAIAPSGELALSLEHAFEGWMGEGTLARVQMFGSGPRPVAERVREADWTGDGRDLAIVRRVNGRERLEFPIGTPLYETSGYISHIRLSRDGQRIAFADHPLYADDNGDLAVVDRAGVRKVLASGFQGLRGVAWSPDGTEVWFTAMNAPDAGVSLRAVSLEGRSRTILSLPLDWRILDVARDGRLLISGEIVSRHIELWREGDSQPQELGGMFEQATGTVISRDGASVLITDQGGFAGAAYATYLRNPDREQPVRLGEGQALEFSPDGRSVLSVVYGPPSRLLLLPIGPGQTKALPNPDGLTIPVAAFVPDGRHIVFLGSQGTAPLKGYVQEIDDGSRRTFTPDGVNTSSFAALPITPDGSAAWLLGADGHPYLFPLSGEGPKPLRGVLPNENLVMWGRQGRDLYASAASGVPQKIVRVDLATGTRTLWKEVVPSQRAGVRLSQVTATEDGRTILHSYAQLLTNLYIVAGVRTAR